jgi:hypothetical protein
MKLSEGILAKLSKTYEPSAMIEQHYNGKDMAFKTDAHGRPILLFIGRRDADGTIKGERYARTLKTDREGKPLKDHWERKGKAN